MAKAKGKQKTDFQKNFTMLHNEFIESTALNAHEKLVFISIKRHLNSDTLKSFPSLATIAKHSRLSKRAVQRAIESLTDKGIIQKEHRQNPENNGNQSNEYTLYDYKSMWIAAKDEIKEVIEIERQAEIASGLSTEVLQKELERRRKEKGLVSDSSQTADTSTHQNNFPTGKDSTEKLESQAKNEKYSMDDVKALYERDSLVEQYPDREQEIDSCINILYDTLNTQKGIIKIGGEGKLPNVVKGRLLKLKPEDIIFVIEKFHEQDTRIKNVTAYLLTALYNAPGQAHADLMNLGHHNHDF